MSEWPSAGIITEGAGPVVRIVDRLVNSSGKFSEVTVQLGFNSQLMTIDGA